MPVPPLPLEVGGLIVDQLAASIKDEEESRSMGIRVALVCKAWKEVGLEMAWWTVSIDTGEENDGLLQLLHQRPAAASRIRHLEVTDPKVEPSRQSGVAPERLLKKLQDILKHSTRLYSVRLCDPLLVVDLLETLSKQPYRNRVQRLSIQGDVPSCAAYQRLIGALSAFSSFTFLTFLTFFSSDTDVAWPIPFPPIAGSLSTPRLAIGVGGSPASFRQVIAAFTSIIDLSSIQRLDVGAPIVSRHLFAWLPNCSNLVELRLSFPSGDQFIASLPLLLTTFPHLSNIIELYIYVGSLEDIVEPTFSPATLSTFLPALPPSLAVGQFDGFYFRHDDGLEPMRPSLAELQMRCACLLGVEESDNGPLRVAFGIAVSDSHGGRSWSLVLQPNDSDDEIDDSPAEEEEDSGEDGAEDEERR